MPSRVTPNRVVVVGGGVIGVCCAYFLARRGVAVTLLERDAVGKGASFGNAGCIAPAHGPINRPGRVAQALKSLFDPLSPLYVAPRFTPGLFRWLRLFAQSCTRGHQERALSALAPLGHATGELFDRLIAEEGIDCAYRRTGYYEVFRTDPGFDVAKQEAAAARTHGFRPEVLVGGALRDREACFHESVLGGVFFPEAASINPYRFVGGLADAATRRGVTIRTGVDVTDLVRQGGSAAGVRTASGEMVAADTVVLATGAYSLALTRRAGLRLPLQAAKGYHRDRDPAVAGTPPMRVTCMLGERSIFCTPMDGFVRFAGTLEFSGVNHAIHRPRLEQLTTGATAYFRGMGPAASLSEWCGLRPCLPDGLPAIGRVPAIDNVYLATGHAMLGLTLGPVTGQLISELVLEGRPALDVKRFQPDRFS